MLYYQSRQMFAIAEPQVQFSMTGFLLSAFRWQAELFSIKICVFLSVMKNAIPFDIEN
jgi:hypothetical protein